MKIRSYMIAVAILLFSFSSAANKAIADLGHVEIDDLFYNSGTTSINGEIEKFEFDQIDKILIKNEDLELESLGIADIDLATFGEYESFLNKYYDDNFTEINSKLINQVEVFTGGSFGWKIPFGQNAKTNMKDGIKLGVNFKDLYSYKFLDRTSSVNLDFSLSINDHVISNQKRWKILSIDTFSETKLFNNFKAQIGLGLISIQYKNELSSNRSLGSSFFFGLNYDFQIFNNITITLFSKAQLEKVIISDNDVLYNDNASVETLIFGLSSSMPVYIEY